MAKMTHEEMKNLRKIKRTEIPRNLVPIGEMKKLGVKPTEEQATAWAYQQFTHLPYLLYDKYLFGIENDETKRIYEAQVTLKYLSKTLEIKYRKIYYDYKIFKEILSCKTEKEKEKILESELMTMEDDVKEFLRYDVKYFLYKAW